MHELSQEHLFRIVLEKHGYTISLRVEIEVRNGTEVYRGSALDSDAAWSAVLDQMLPSQLARQCFQEALESRCNAPESEQQSDSGDYADPTATETNGETQTTAMPPVASNDVTEPAEPEAARVQVVATGPSRPTRLEIEALHEDLNELVDTMNAHMSELPRWSPLRQRLKITEWIAAARSTEERSNWESSITDRVHGVAKQLSRLARISWPGHVDALKMDCGPEDAGITIDGFQSSPQKTWKECERQCREQLDFLNAEASRNKEDAEGWFDAAQLSPQPSDAQARLAVIADSLEKLTGPLVPVGALNGHMPEVPNIQIVDQALVDQSRREWADWAKVLRWLRGSELEQWGVVIGRMRWLACTMRDAALEKVLESPTAPDRNWARANGYDPLRQQRRKERKKLLSSLHAVAPGDALLNWLRQALLLGEDLNNDRLLPHLRGRRDEFLALGVHPKGLDQRAARSRWKKLHAQLAQDTLPPSAWPEPEEDAESADVQVEEHPVHPLESHVRAVMQGKRVLIVSNRNDDARDRELAERLGIVGMLKAIVYSERKGDSATQAIGNGSYDYVLALTGFLSHAADRKLKQATRKAGVVYVRANRGRPTACIDALARDLGLRN